LINKLNSTGIIADCFKKIKPIRDIFNHFNHFFNILSICNNDKPKYVDAETFITVSTGAAYRLLGQAVYHHIRYNFSIERNDLQI
jgi:hypothetical protein